MSTQVPFTILTGFLGAGKTTVVNRMLANPGGRRIAVLVNELGRVAIDGSLILSQGGDVLELAGGCVCCKIDVKNDLWDGIADVVKRSKPDAVVLETTGIAEPPQIVEGIQNDNLPVDLAGVVCVVDAQTGGRFIAEREEASVQVECADRVLLSKLDVATPEQAALAHERITQRNDSAERASFPGTEDGARAMTSWVLERRRTRRLPHKHHHNQVTAMAYEDPAPLLREQLMGVIERARARLLRVKGFVRLVGQRGPAFLELAGDSLTLTERGEWDGEPRNQLVLIGEGLDEAAIRRQLWGCRTAT